MFPPGDGIAHVGDVRGRRLMDAVLMNLRTPELAELLSVLIRNRCVSSGMPSTGEEARNVATLRTVLEGPGLDIDVVEPVPGRPSLVARIQGRDPLASSICLMGHTDVVPADPGGWRHDPFGGELIDGEIWGRGALDMLHQTAAMALALRSLADSGARPAGDIVFWAVPDEECGGHQGARLMTEGWADLIRSDVVLTEVGGAVAKDASDLPVVEAYAAEKGTFNLIVTVRGTQAHSSMPFRVSNPLVAAAEVIRRLDAWEPVVQVSEPWRRYVTERYGSGPLSDALLDATSIDEALDALEPNEARHAHACTRCTLVPTIIQGGDKVNTIPSSVTIAVNLRHTWDDSVVAIVDELRLLLADLVDADDIVMPGSTPPTVSAVDTNLWAVLQSVTADLLGGARLLPSVLAAQTDARWLRPAGTTVYGFGLLNPALDPSDYWARFHGVDERVDLTSLSLMLDGYEEVVRRYSGLR